MDTKRLRIANLPPEIANDVLREALAPFRKILDLRTDSWSKTYRYVVSNGIPLATVDTICAVPSNRGGVQSPYYI
jgi:hypothetical protein